MQLVRGKPVQSISFEAACAQYPYRFTMEHVPHWAQHPVIGDPTKFYAPQFRTDREWYENSQFFSFGPCYTVNESWPLGQWLDKPYKRGQ